MFKIKLTDAKRLLNYLLDQWGLDYLLGVENDGITKAKFWDCSELSEKGFNIILSIPLPDGSGRQLKYCKEIGEEVYYPISKVQPLDLVFLKKKDSEEIGHVAIVYGNMDPVGGMMLIEARGGRFGKVMFTPLDKFLIEFHKRFAGIFRIVEING